GVCSNDPRLFPIPAGLPVPIKQPSQFILNFMLVLHAGEKDSYAVSFVLEVRCFIVQYEKDLPLFPKVCSS
ncbi:MAG TPA: hypothetical protein VLL74_06260, partial [Methanoregula sp.]|nr:hypothetical protein [Methanoregula sp.]